MNLRRLFVSVTPAMPCDLQDRKIIVTGATPGTLGFATARLLAAWGADIVISTRAQCEAAVAALQAALPETTPWGTPCGRVVAQTLDLCQAGSVERFASWYAARRESGGRLDALINNAGIHLDLRSQWKEPQRTNDGHEIHWRTNYLGTMHLTHHLLPLLRSTAAATGDARIVNVVSQLHSRGRNADLFGMVRPYNSWNAYGNSKLALMHATRELQRRYGDEKLRACSLHPGAVYTHIADRGLAGSSLIASVRKAVAPIEAFFLLTPEEGAQTSVHCATATNLEGGCYFTDCRPAPASRELEDGAVAQRLWEETQRWLDGLPGAASD